MELELEPRVKPLAFKVKAMSRESPAQKASHLLDSDLRNHWSTATNTKEWILLELDEPCLLSHLRIYNKSVLEWEITVGLRYKPEAFVKVRPRCEAPRRDVLYPMNYTPCRYVRISCLRGNPIAIFFIQLIGISVTGLEPEFQPVINYLLPHIISHKQDAHDMHLQLLHDIANRLVFLLPQLEADLMSFTDSTVRFLAMLAGPCYPILRVVNERDAARVLLNSSESDACKNNQSSTLTVSSNFEAQPRRSGSPLPFIQSTSSSIAFRSDAVITLLRKAYKDSHLGIVCRIASRALQKLVEPSKSLGESIPTCDLSSSLVSGEMVQIEAPCSMFPSDYSSLFGEEFKIHDDHWDTAFLNVMDIAAVEEGILHVIYACASQPLLCCKLAESNSNFWSILPLVQALLPALRPLSTSPDQVDDSYWQWKHLSAQHALSQIVAMSSSLYRPLLHSCAGYLSSFSSSHAKAACVLIDLCSGPFSPWISTIVAKVDLSIEILEDLLGIIQGACQSIARARAALKCIILALSGHMDDILPSYKQVKHKLLFLLEMLEPFLDPAITPIKSTVAFGDVSSMFVDSQERTCALALNVVRTAARRPSVLPYLESEWRRGSVAPSVLLSILGPHMPLPPDVDLCKCPVSEIVDLEPCRISSKCNIPYESNGKVDASETTIRLDTLDDSNLLFAPIELKKTKLISVENSPDKDRLENSQGNTTGRHLTKNIATDPLLDYSFFSEYFNLEVDFLQLVNHQDCELRASEFKRLSLDLCSQPDITPEGHDAAIDALLLAAECYVNPFFMMSFRPTSSLFNQMNTVKSKINKTSDVTELDRNFLNSNNLEAIAHLERKRDELVLHILLQAAKLDCDYQESTSQGEPYPCGLEEGVNIPLLDIQSADAVTLVRNNQALLCHFVMLQLQREQHSSHEILLHSLLFLLYSATELYCPPENVIDIILQSAESLNGQLTSLYYQLKEGNIQFEVEKLHGLQRHWVILQRLVIASSGRDCGTDFTSPTHNGFQYRSLVPPSSWIHRIPKFSNCPYPLPRFLGWMAVSRYSKQFLKDQLFLVSELSQLTSMLSIFTDELALIDGIVERKVEALNSNNPDTKSKCYAEGSEDFGNCDQSVGRESYILYPDLHKFFPNIKKRFGSFGESILEAVGLHLKSFPSSAVPDILCWFSDLCLWPYPETLKDFSFEISGYYLKGYAATNAKAIVLYILESIVCEHMEAVVPEMPRVAQILLSLCKASYCDTAFLDSIFCLLRPLVLCFLGRVDDDENQLTDGYSHLDFELNFEELFDSIRCRKDQVSSGEKSFEGSLMIFVLGALFLDLSFRRKIEALKSLSLWVDFATSEPTSAFYDYLCAFQKVIDSCIMLLVQSLESFGILIPVERNPSSEADLAISFGGNSNFPFVFQVNENYLTRPSREFRSSNTGAGSPVQQVHVLSLDEVKEFSEGLELLVTSLFPAIEVTWKLHYQLTLKLTFISSKSILFSRCLNSIVQAAITTNSNGEGTCPADSGDVFSKHWRNALEGFTRVIITNQQIQCWQVASAMLDYLLTLPQSFTLDYAVGIICPVIKHFCIHAPRISWRLQTCRWLSSLFLRGITSLGGNEASLVDLFTTMLVNSEPEQRSIAFQILGRIVGLGSFDGLTKLSYAIRQNLLGSESVISLPESIISLLVSNTWDRVAALALSDPSLLLRTHAVALLFGYIPFAEQSQLRSFLVASDVLLQGIGKPFPIEEGHLSRLSLGLLASACLYSPSEDISLIPESVWRNLERIGMSRTSALDDMEKKMCLALCKLRTESNDARTGLKILLSSNPSVEKRDSKFKGTRESILQVISSMTSVQSYFDFFSKKLDQESQELEEAEIEIDLLQKEKALQAVSNSSQEETFIPPDMPSSLDRKKNNHRLQEIKDEIRLIEKLQLREEIIIRKQKKLLMRRTRQKYLEEAAAREIELLQDLDRERVSESEREIERQQQLELERVKTKELQFNLDLEKERQIQKELQRELEQVQSGVRPLQRDYSSNPNSRARERNRDREKGRIGQEGGGTRSSSRGHEGATPTVLLAGSRSFSGQLPTSLQSVNDQSTTEYEENLEGSRDSGDAGDMESAPRYGNRGNKPRQGMERREAQEGRQEGKWERKYS